MNHRRPSKIPTSLARINRQLAQSQTVMRQICETAKEVESARAVERLRDVPANRISPTSK